MSSFSQIKVYDKTTTFTTKPEPEQGKSTVGILEPIKIQKHSKKTAQRMYTMDKMFSAETGREEEGNKLVDIEPDGQFVSTPEPLRWKT